MLTATACYAIECQRAACPVRKASGNRPDDNTELRPGSPLLLAFQSRRGRHCHISRLALNRKDFEIGPQLVENTMNRTSILRPMTNVHQIPTTAAHRPSTQRLPVWGWLVGVGIPVLVTGWHALQYGRWIVDDAGITFAYARSVASGAGPVLQPGADRVEGFSNPAWLALLTVGRWVGLFDRGVWFGIPDYVAFPKALALVLVAGVFAWMLYAAAAVSRHSVLVTVLAGVATACLPAFVIWCFSGLENSLLAFAVFGIGAVLVRAVVTDRLLSVGTGLTCGLLAALAALTRPDGLVYMAAFPVAVLLLVRGSEPRRAVWAVAASVVTFAIPYGAYVMWRIATFGEVLPNTALAKAQGLPGIDAVSRPGELVAYVGWLAVVIATLAAGVALADSAQRRPLIAGLVPLGLAVAAYGVLQEDWMGQFRFATPVWPLAAFVVAVAVAHIVPRFGRRGRLVICVAFAVAALISTPALLVGYRSFRAAPTAPLCLVVTNTGTAFNDLARTIAVRNGTLLAPDVGGAALTSNLRIVDLAGLTDARIAEFWRTSDWTGLRDYVFNEVRPSFIKAHGPWLAVLARESDPRLDIDYAEVATISGSTEWVRRDLLTEPGSLEALQAAAARTAPVDLRYREAPLSSCGDTLAPTPW